MDNKRERITGPVFSPERMNPGIDPNDPLGMVNYCLYGYNDAEPIFLTRSERQKIEAFLHDESEPSFTLQSGKTLTREKIEEYLDEYEHSIYRGAALNKIFFILTGPVADVLNDEHRKHLEEKVSEISLLYNNESEQQKINNVPLLREAVEEFLSHHPDSSEKEKLQQAISQYDEQYRGGINRENAGEAARILLDVIEALDESDQTVAEFKDKAIRISYIMNSPEMIQKIRDVLKLAQRLLKEEDLK